MGLSLTSVAVDATANPSKDKLMLQADKKAVALMLEAGYDPQAYVDQLHRFLDADKSKAPFFFDYYQSRPVTYERFKLIEKEFAKLPLMGKTISTNYALYQEVMKPVREMYATA